MRRRIAMISTHGYVAAQPPLGAPDTGGQVVFVIELSKQLARLGYKVDIWTRRFDNQPETEMVDENVTILRVPCGSNEFIPKEQLYKNIPEWVENALRLIKKQNLSYYFINSHYWDAGLAGQSLSNALNIPHLHTPHSLGSWKKSQMEDAAPEDTEKLEDQFNFTARVRHEQRLFQECDMVIATTPPQSDLIASDYGVAPAKIRMIPPGYDDNRFFPVSEASRQGIRTEMNYHGPVIASIGRLARNKGFDLLIRAFAIVATRIPEAKLRLAVSMQSSDPGDSRMLEELQELVVEHNLQNKVLITDSLPDEQMADYYRAADVFALSSRYEPFGMTAIEALASGTPTVVTTRGGLYRALDFGVHALYTDTEDIEEFGICLLQALKYQRLRNRISQQGSLRVRALFAWSGIAQQLLRAVEDRLHTGVDAAETPDVSSIWRQSVDI
ncbi:glycosyltransferase [Prosthecobacter sp. SYSU 5D2]|uniref:glycosyltransferase n=1 Tax=Prosthecobacter sp. SYSU 5D2 TaxID=3134134 RepID=UPI0031FF36AB